MSLIEIGQQICRERDAYIAGLLEKVSPGTRICVHETEFKIEEPKFHEDSIKMHYEVNAHILPGTMTCDAQVRREEYTR